MSEALEQVANLFKALGSPRRLQIMWLLRENPTCVCRLQARLGWRQALISQHLTTLRQLGLVTARREGRFVLYSLRYPEMADLIARAAAILQVALPAEVCDPGPCDHCHDSTAV